MAYPARGVLTYLFGDAGGFSVTFAGALDWRVATLGVAIGLGSVFLFGLAPALQASNVDLAPALKADARSSVGNTGGRGRLRAGLVVLQVSSSFVLLVGAGLLLISLRRLRSESPGFADRRRRDDGDQPCSRTVTTPRAPSSCSTRNCCGASLALPAVEGAAFARGALRSASAPTTERRSRWTCYHPVRDDLQASDYNQVTPGYSRRPRDSALVGTRRFHQRRRRPSGGGGDRE